MEQDNVLLKGASKAYIFEYDPQAKKGKYKEIGQGDFQINIYTDNNNKGARIVMHTHKTKRLVFHVSIFKQMKYEIFNKMYVKFISIDTKIYLLKFKTIEKVQEVYDTITKAIEQI